MSYRMVQLLDHELCYLYLILTIIIWCLSIRWFLRREDELSGSQKASFLFISATISSIIALKQFGLEFAFFDLLFRGLPIVRTMLFVAIADNLVYAIIIGAFWTIVHLFYRKLSWIAVLQLSLFGSLGSLVFFAITLLIFSIFV